MLKPSHVNLDGFRNNRSHTCTTLDNGSAMCWGYNLYGQLGDNTTGQKLTPVGVSGLQNAKTISALVVITPVLLSTMDLQCVGGIQ